MLTILEIFTAIVGLKILHIEVIVNRFRSYVTSMFLVCFVPLFCVYPVLARILVGGAYSVRVGDDQVIDNSAVYIIYHFFCLGILFVTFATQRKSSDSTLQNWNRKYNLSVFEYYLLTAFLVLGIYVYIHATGLSAIDLMLASRFEWFNNIDYSPVMSIISSYLIAIAPIALLLSLYNKKNTWATAVILLLIFYGILSKDRKWLMYIISATFAYVYIKNGFCMFLRRKSVALGVLAVAVLAFWQIGRGVVFSYLVTGNGDIVYDSQEMAVTLMTRGDLPYYYNASMTAIDMNLLDGYSIPFGIVRRQILFFLPANYSLGLKIEDISAIFSDAIGGEDQIRRGNMPPGLFGLFALSFGWFGGIITCSLVPFVFRALDRFIQRNRGVESIVILAHTLSSVMLLLRGDDSSATYFIISSIALFYIIRVIARLRLIDSGGVKGVPEKP